MTTADVSASQHSRATTITLSQPGPDGGAVTITLDQDMHTIAEHCGFHSPIINPLPPLERVRKYMALIEKWNKLLLTQHGANTDEGRQIMAARWEIICLEQVITCLAVSSKHKKSQSPATLTAITFAVIRAAEVLIEAYVTTVAVDPDVATNQVLVPLLLSVTQTPIT